MKTPYNHYFYLLTIQREFIKELHSKYLEIKNKLTTQKDLHDFLDKNLPDNLKKSGSLGYYEQALKFYDSNSSYTFRVDKTITKLLTTINNDYSGIEKMCSDKIYHFDYLKPFITMLSRLGNEQNEFGLLECYSCFATITSTLEGVLLKIYAPIYKQNVIIATTEEEFIFNKENKEEVPEWAEVIVKTLKLTEIPLKRLKVVEPNVNRNLEFYRDVNNNKIVLAPTFILE